jgi:hypothetical protein
MIKGSREEVMNKKNEQEAVELTEETLDDLTEEGLDFLVIDNEEEWVNENENQANETKEEENKNAESEEPKEKSQKKTRRTRTSKRTSKRTSTKKKATGKGDTTKSKGSKKPATKEAKKNVSGNKSEKDEPKKPVSSIDDEIKGKLYLSDVELAQINLFNEKYRTYEEIQAHNDTRKKLIDAQVALMDAKKEILKRDKIILDNIIKEDAQKREGFKKRNREFLESISKSHPGLEKIRWGYNPESGEIITE